MLVSRFNWELFVEFFLTFLLMSFDFVLFRECECRG